jgi:hypothetical protein
MTATDVVCPTCGAELAPELSSRSYAGVWLGRCQNQHWWLQSAMFGWISIDPAAITEAGGTTMEAEESC